MLKVISELQFCTTKSVKNLVPIIFNMEADCEESSPKGKYLRKWWI
jgi:hypothetical protein